MIRFPENEQQLKGSRQIPRPFLPPGSPGIPFLLPHAAGGSLCRCPVKARVNKGAPPAEKSRPTRMAALRPIRPTAGPPAEPESSCPAVTRCPPEPVPSKARVPEGCGQYTAPPPVRRWHSPQIAAAPPHREPQAHAQKEFFAGGQGAPAEPAVQNVKSGTAVPLFTMKYYLRTGCLGPLICISTGACFGC